MPIYTMPSMGSALAQAISNLAPGLSQYMAGRALNRMYGQDIQALNQYQQNQQYAANMPQDVMQARQAAGLPGQMNVPFPNLQSPQMREMAAQMQLQQALSPQLSKQVKGEFQTIEDPENPGQMINALINPQTGQIIQKFPAKSERKGQFQQIEDPNNPGKIINALINPETGEIMKTFPTKLEPSQQISQKKLDEINRLQAKVDSGKASEGDKMALEKMLIGQPQVQIAMGQPASPTERTAIAETRASLDSLNNIKSLYETGKVKIGPIKGRTEPILGLIGQTTNEQEAFMAATSSFKNQVIKDITGAQMSEIEATRIMKQIPDITDPPARWEAKWEQTKKNLDMIQKRRAEVLKQSGIKVPEDEIKTNLSLQQTDYKKQIEEEVKKRNLKPASLMFESKVNIPVSKTEKERMADKAGYAKYVKTVKAHGALAIATKEQFIDAGIYRYWQESPPKQKPKKPEFKTTRTIYTEEQLRKAGIDEKTIQKLRD